MLRLVAFAPLHFAELAGWFTNEREIVQWGGPGVSFPLDTRQAQAMIDDSDRPARRCWMVASGAELVGHAQLGFDWRNGVATLGRVAVAPAARGRRLALPMLKLVLEQAFARGDIERVELSVYPWNATAIRVYERLGFVAEGTKRSAVRVGTERWDNAIMGLLRAEWQGRS